MTSRHLRSVAADSNVLLSAVIGKSALKVFTHTDLEILTTAFNVLEIEEYLPFLSGKYGVDINHLRLQFRMLPIHIIDAAEYKAKLPLAKEHIGSRDSDDVHLAALALAKNVPIWSNDKDFEHIPGITVYPTAKLLRVFGL